MIGALGSLTSAASWRVLVAAGDRVHAQAVAGELRRHGHAVSHVDTGRATLRIFARFDLVLLDLDLSDPGGLDGLDVCREMRGGSGVPIIAVTARAAELDRVRGLRAGADDCLVRPYGFRELIARMEAVMRRAQPQLRPPASGAASSGAASSATVPSATVPSATVPSATVSYGPLLVDAGRRAVSLDGRPVDLTRKEFDLLYLLASHPQVVIERRRLMHLVWGDSWSRRTLDTHVSSLRGKLGSSRWIITARGVGFRLGTLEELG